MKERKAIAAGTKKIQLDQEEQDLVKFLNRQGLATDEQFQENSSY